MKNIMKSTKTLMGFALVSISLGQLCTAYAGGDSCYFIYAHKLTEVQKNSIDNLDFISLYRDVLFSFNNRTKDAWMSNFDYVTKFHAKVKKMIIDDMSESDRLELAKEVQDVGYFLPQKRDAIDNVKNPSLGAKINDTALKYLEEISKSNNDIQKGLAAYRSAYENFATGGNKLKASNLGLQSLSFDQLSNFFKLAGKDLSSDQIKKAIEGDVVLINLFQQSFSDLQLAGKNIKNQVARKIWEEKIVGNQMNALTNSYIVSKISKDLELANKYLRLTQEQRNKFIWTLYTYIGQYNGTNGYSADVLVRSKYEDIPREKLILDQTIDHVVSKKISDLENKGLRLELMGSVRQTTLFKIIENHNFTGEVDLFVKDAPTYAIEITNENWKNIPAMLAREGIRIGDYDSAKYPQGLKPFIGGAVNFQIGKNGVDAYPISPEVFFKYQKTPKSDVAIRNRTYASKILNTGFRSIFTSLDVKSILRLEPTEMVLMSHVGFDISKSATIQAPWGGTQRKEAGKDAYLAILRNHENGSIKEMYIVQIDSDTGLPMSYLSSSKGNNTSK